MKVVQYLGAVILLFCVFNLNAQDPYRFKSQIDELDQTE